MVIVVQTACNKWIITTALKTAQLYVSTVGSFATKTAKLVSGFFSTSE